MSRFPWWVSIVLAVLAYCGLKYGLVELLPDEHRLIGLLQLLAPLAAMGFLLLAGKQLYDGEQKADSGQDSDSPGDGKG
jgi:hypothetical protein